MAKPLQPKKITLTTMDGQERTYIISKFPATVARNILARLGEAGAGPEKHHGPRSDEDELLTVMSHVAVEIEGHDKPLRLASWERVIRHVPDWRVLQRIKEEMLAYNTSFMRDWRRLDFLRHSGADASAEEYRNVDSLIGKVVASGRATLGELRTEYTLEDAMRIWEATVVPEFNDYKAVKEARWKAGR